MGIIEEDTNNFLVRLADLAPKTVGVIPWLEEPSYEQKEWFVHKMKAPASSWKGFPHKPWILRWNYFVIGDYE